MTGAAEKNIVRRLLDEGARPVGTFLMEFVSPGIAQLAAAAGSDFIFWDLQHTGWGPRDIAAGIASTQSLDIVPGVRVPGPQPELIGQALDLGAKMIMVPAVATAEQARAIVDATRYPIGDRPGHRAVTFSFAWDGYQPAHDAAAALQHANDDVVVFVQIETAEGVGNVDEIAAVPGIDVLWVGDNDLAASLGVPGDFTAQKYQTALDAVVEAARSHGKAAGFTTASVEAGQALLRRGYRVLAFGNDIKVFRDALRDGVAGLRTP